MCRLGERVSVSPAQRPTASATRRTWKGKEPKRCFHPLAAHLGPLCLQLPGAPPVPVAWVPLHPDTGGCSPLARSSRTDDPRFAPLALSCLHAPGPPHTAPSLPAFSRH